MRALSHLLGKGGSAGETAELGELKIFRLPLKNRVFDFFEKL
jgi:hypothetical protein